MCCRAPPIQDFTYGQLRQGELCLDAGDGFANQPVMMKPCLREMGNKQVSNFESCYKCMYIHTLLPAMNHGVAIEMQAGIFFAL